MSGQLSLFKGKRQKGTKLPPPKEFGMHCMVADVVRRWISPGWIWTHIGHGEKRDSITGARLKRMGLQPGFPDFQFFHEAGRCCFLELKRKGNGLDENQTEIAKHLRRAGHGYLVTDSFNVAVAQLVKWEIVRWMTVQ